MPQIYDMGPTASAGFEPANVGTKGQHATLRPPKPFLSCICGINLNDLRFLVYKKGIRKVSEHLYVYTKQLVRVQDTKLVPSSPSI